MFELEYKYHNTIDLNGDLVVTAVAESIVKGPDTLRLVRHATAILCLGNTIGFVRRIAKVEVGRPDIAVYIMHTRQRNSPLRIVDMPKVKASTLTGDFVLNRTTAAVVPKHDFVVPVAIALHLPARCGAHAAFGLAHRAVEVVVVPDVDVHGVVEGTRTPHVRMHANARLCAGRHQDSRSKNRLHIHCFRKGVFDAFGVGCGVGEGF